jgi:hypothetical protein
MDWIQYNSLEEIPKYNQKKQLVYLDQNVLSEFLKNYMREAVPAFRDEYQIVYSQQTLSEIKWAGVNRNPEDTYKYLDLLSNLKAIHVRPLTDGGVIEHEQLALREESPYVMMKELDSDIEFKSI